MKRLWRRVMELLRRRPDPAVVYRSVTRKIHVIEATHRIYRDYRRVSLLEPGDRLAWANLASHIGNEILEKGLCQRILYNGLDKVDNPLGEISTIRMRVEVVEPTEEKKS